MDQAITTDIPARLDRLPWSRFHLLIVVALGITWVLDGLEVTIVGSIGPMLEDHRALGLTARGIGLAASSYVAGAVLGAMVFGWLTDRFGRRAIFNVTLAIYVVGVLLTACSWSLASFCLFRVITGLGIGGEYAAINSAIDELIPAKARGRIDLIVNGSFWIGAAAGAAASLPLLSGALPPDVGWRLGFGIGGVLGLSILLLRRFVPESPRWLVTHGRAAEAEAIVTGIERRIVRQTGRLLDKPKGTITIHPRKVFGFGMIARAMLGKYKSRSLLALVLMAAQAFLFNAVFFTYGLVLAKFYHVPAARIGLYILPLAVGNFAGPLLMGHLFDSVIGRRRMIFITYAAAGLLLAATAFTFGIGALTATSQTAYWMAIFFFASAAASSAYLTASEIFPLETRALAIAVFYALGTALGGVLAPALFGALIASSDPWQVAYGYLASAALLLIAAVTGLALGVDAEGKSLEEIAQPLSS